MRIIQPVFLLLLLAASFQLSAQSDDETDTYYYEYSTVTFCTSVSADGEPVGGAETFQLGSTGKVNLIVYIENNGQPFKTSSIYIEIYDASSNPVEDFQINIQPDWDYVHFEYSIMEKGTYYFDIYSGIDVFINSGTVIIE